MKSSIAGWVIIAACSVGLLNTLGVPLSAVPAPSTPFAPIPVPQPPAQPPAQPTPSPCPGPNCPAPRPSPTPPPRRPWADLDRLQFAAISTGGPRLADGTEVQVYLPASQRIRNIGSRVDGAGMCVMSSVEMMFRWGNLEAYRGLRDWCAQKPGGGYPSKVDQQLNEYATARQTPLPPYFQYEGADPALLRASLASGRPVAITYGASHMVLLVHFDDRHVGILDNNAIGEEQLLWMTPQEFMSRWVTGGRGWAVFSIAPPPPPVPHNARPAVRTVVTQTAPAPSVSIPGGVQSIHLSVRERITYRGQVISRDEAMTLIQGSIPDDLSFVRVTVIGPDTERQAVIDAIKAQPSPLQIVLNSYPPDHWAVSGVGFVTSGHPTVYVQRPDGVVLHRQDNYDGGIASLVRAIRIADPAYNPTNDPNVNKSSLPFSIPQLPISTWLCGIGAGLLFLKQ